MMETNKNHAEPTWVTACLISPHVGTLIIKRLAEAAFVSSSVVVAAAAATVPEPVATASTETPSPAASEPSSVTAVTATKASVPAVTATKAAVTGRLFFQLWQFRGHSQLPAAAVRPGLLSEKQAVQQECRSLSTFLFLLN